MKKLLDEYSKGQTQIYSWGSPANEPSNKETAVIVGWIFIGVVVSKAFGM